MDVFSSGLMILELALSFPSPYMREVRIQDINKKEWNLREALAEFTKIKKTRCLDDLLQRMLVWRQEDRLDFIELEDYLVYERQLDIKKKFTYVEIDQGTSTFRVWTCFGLGSPARQNRR